MSYFGDHGIKDAIYDDVTYDAEQHNASSVEVIEALSLMIQYYTEKIKMDEEDNTK
jgi:hypothetical protein